MNYTSSIQQFPGVVIQTGRHKNDDVSVIIPAAGLGRRMKSYGPKALIDIGSETVLSRQITIIKKAFPYADITVVVGFEAERVCRSLPNGVRVIENEFHENTNVARSLDLGLRSCINDKVLVVYGDLVFNEATFADLTLSESFAVIDKTGQIGEEEVGATLVEEGIGQFGYDLKTKWAQIVFLTGKELKLVRRIVADPDRRKCFGFEILNTMLDKGGKLKPISPDGMKIAEIDCSKDIENAIKVTVE